MPAQFGVRRAKVHVATFLEENLPAHLVALRTEWGLDAESLPDPAQYKANQPKALDKFPILSVSASRKVRLRRLDVSDDDVIDYWATYALKVHTWVDVTEWDHAIEVRDDLTAAVSLLLLDRQALRVAGDVAVLQEQTMVEEYSDAVQVKGDRYVCGAFVGFDLRVTELVTRTPSGTVVTTELETGLLPHPAL